MITLNSKYFTGAIKNTIIAMSLTVLPDLVFAGSQGPNFAMPVSWTGFYGGVSVGGIANSVDLHSQHLGFTDPNETCDGSTDFSSFFPGVQAGYLYQLNPKILLGVEGDFTYNVNQSTKIHCTCPITPTVSDRFVVKNQLQGSIRGRLGYALNNQLFPFITGGASFADLGMNYKNEGSDYYSKNRTQSGWLAGAGLEWRFERNWSVRVEYSYTDYGNLKMAIPDVYGLYDPNGGAHVNLDVNSVKAAVNYWF